MIDSYYRAPFQRWCVDPVAQSVVLHPNLITSLSLVSGIGAAAALVFGHEWLALFLWVLSGYLDVLDGSMARKWGRSSHLGAALDLVSDRVVEFTFVIALFAVDTQARALPCLLMLGSMYLCVTSFFVVSMFTQGESEKSFVYSPGLIERAETFIVFGAMIFVEKTFFSWALVYSSLVFLTTFIRMWEFTRQKL